MRKIVKRIGIGLAAFLVIGALVGSIVIGKMVGDGVIHQNEGLDTKKNSREQLEKWGYDWKGFLETYKGVDFAVQAKDGVEVPGTYYESQEGNKRTVILAHGAGGERLCLAPLAEAYLKNGISVVTYDQRGSGESKDPKVSFGYYEKQDIERLVQYAKEEMGAETVYVHGQSMGAMTVALYAATEKAKEQVDAVILDSPVPGMENMLRLMFGGEEEMNSLQNDYILGCGGIYLKLFYGFSYSDTDSIEKMKQNHIKTMVILSEKDEVCLPRYVKQLYDNIAAKDKELLRVNSAHVEGIIDDPEGYIQSVMKFLNE